MKCCCENCGWLSVNPSGAMFCGYSDKRIWKDKYCLAWKDKDEPLTNADRIRAMSDEELADFVNDAEYGFLDRPGMCDVCDHHRIKDCLACWLDWLKSPVEGEE